MKRDGDGILDGDLERGGLFGDQPYDRATLGDDWMASFLKEALPHIRTLLRHPSLSHDPAASALEQLLQEHQARYESRVEFLAGAAEAMDAETDRLRAAILEKVYAWQALPAETRRQVIRTMMLSVYPTADAAAAMGKATDILQDNLPPESEDSEGPYR